MKEFHLYGEVAEECGVNASILFYNIAFWVEHNEANGANKHDGRYWTYNSMEAFSQLFPFLSAKQIKTALKKLEDNDYIVTGNYNKMPFDHTKWYALTDKAYSMLPKGQMQEDKKGQFDQPSRSNEISPQGPMRLDQKVQPIPDNNTDNKLTDNKHKKERKKVSKKQSYDELIEEYTSNPNLQETLKAFIQMRAFIKKPMTAYALKLMLNKLSKLANNDSDKITILNNSIEHNWQGIFELKQNTYQQNNYQPSYTNQPKELPKKDPAEPKRPLPGDYAIPGGGFDLERYQKDADAYNAWLRSQR